MKTAVLLLAGALIGVAVAQTANTTSNTTPAAPAAAASAAPAPAAAPTRGGGGGSQVHPVSQNINDRLTKSPRHFDIVKVKQGDRDVETYIFYPAGKDKAMAVILIHEIFGLSDWMRAAGDQLAEAGYIVLVPDLLSGTGPNKGGTLDLPENQVTRAVQTLPAAQITADLNALVDYAKKLPGCNGNIAVGGFCWGGGRAFAFSTANKDIKGAFVFYGAPMLPEAEMPKVNCPIYGFYGENDNVRLNPAAVKAEEAAMKAAGKTYDAVVYAGAGHGFMRSGQMDNASPAEKKAQEEAWKRFTDILAKLNTAPAAAKPAG